MSTRRRLIHPPALLPIPQRREPPGILVVPRDTIVDDSPPVFEVQAPRSRPLLWLFAAVLVILPPIASAYTIVAVRRDPPSAKDARLAQRERPLTMRTPHSRGR